MCIQVMGSQFRRARPAFCLSPILGVVGERGSLASSEFLLSICAYDLNGDEQESSSVILYSDVLFESLARTDKRHLSLIYPIKKNPDPEEFSRMLEAYLDKYEVDSFIAGCSEIHLLAKRFMRSGANRQRYRCIDSPDIIASSLSQAPVWRAAPV